ncbi:hypothetical protein JT739_07595 [Tepidanaerobacter sp. GT38]|uniref:Lin0368 family putative glycerol transporter subunit n=1 Tax=Tepidanaerobacter sp. GT38 TaxID=2722793 RepID=UPI001F38E3EE|nr:hypothetical protein [Tepidanaerobacter sp. GT38]MCG1012462.1 hypothetical protein [Tepidanaerobacter sp. GT38]
MTFPKIIATMAGGFIFPFLIRLAWGKLVDNFGPIGGWLAAGFIVGTTWTLNHGVGLIYQSGAAWIDMAWAGFVGLFVASALSGDDVGKGIGMVINAILGGILGGFILYCLYV